MSERKRIVDTLDDEQKQRIRRLARTVDFGYKRDESEPFHADDMVLALNTQTKKKEVGKVRWTDPQYKSARIIFQPKVYESGHIVHMSADIPYSDLRMHTKYHYDPNASIVDLLCRYDE